MKIQKYIKLSLALWLIMLICSCTHFFPTPIGKILANVREYDGKIVKVRGEVTETVSFFVIKYFKIKDKTGEIAVITEKPLPRKGEIIAIKGTVHEAFSLGDKSITVIFEESPKR